MKYNVNTSIRKIEEDLDSLKQIYFHRGSSYDSETKNKKEDMENLLIKISSELDKEKLKWLK